MEIDRDEDLLDDFDPDGKTHKVDYTKNEVVPEEILADEDKAEAEAEEETVATGAAAAELPEYTSISITANSILDPNYDPFRKIIDEKSDDKRYYHRALNVKPSVLNKRKSQGYEIVPGQKNPHGDLILGRLPREMREARVKAKQEKTKRQTRAVNERFKEEAARVGMETFDESTNK